MRASDYDYRLAPESIATSPAEPRDSAKLLRLPHAGGPVTHHHFRDLPELLQPGDCLVVNDSRVLPARLLSTRRGGGAVELLLLRPHGEACWEALVRPARKMKAGRRIAFGDGTAEILEATGDKTRLIRFLLPAGIAFPNWLERHGHVPLPPYILHARRELGLPATDTIQDRERYQTVYAHHSGSVAAPTAGLHFTPELLERLSHRGVELRRVTLHVGLGTFEALPEDRELQELELHEEFYAIEEQEAVAIEAARIDASRRLIAVGTTAVRVLETCMERHATIREASGPTRLFIRPGFRFQAVDGMITNFHLPRSSLLILVAAWAGRERILDAYASAIAHGYRFYSYGDAMLID